MVRKHCRKAKGRGGNRNKNTHKKQADTVRLLYALNTVGFSEGFWFLIGSVRLPCTQFQSDSFSSVHQPWQY